MKFLCTECGNNFEALRFVKKVDKLIDGQVTYYETKCPACNKWTKNEQGEAFGRATCPAAYDKARKRLLGSNIMIVGRERWHDVPNDIAEKLEEEKRLRALRENNVGEAEQDTERQESFKEGASEGDQG
jgi:hypothetical protein